MTTKPLSMVIVCSRPAASTLLDGNERHHTRIRQRQGKKGNHHWMRLGRKYHWPSERSQLSTSVV